MPESFNFFRNLGLEYASYRAALRLYRLTIENL